MADQLMVGIEVTPEIAQMIRFMAESNVFGIATGSATIHFSESKITTIEVKQYTYAKSYPLSSIKVV